MCPGALYSTCTVPTVDCIQEHVQKRLLYIGKRKNLAPAHRTKPVHGVTASRDQRNFVPRDRCQHGHVYNKICTVRHVSTRTCAQWKLVQNHTCHQGHVFNKHLCSTTLDSLDKCTIKLSTVRPMSTRTRVPLNFVQYGTCQRGHVNNKNLYSRAHVNVSTSKIIICTVRHVSTWTSLQ